MRHFSTTILFLRVLQLAAKKLVQALCDHPVYQLRIIGYADSRGNEEYNQAPSERRAEAVKRYFIDWKVDPQLRHHRRLGRNRAGRSQLHTRRHVVQSPGRVSVRIYARPHALTLTAALVTKNAPISW